MLKNVCDACIPLLSKRIHGNFQYNNQLDSTHCHIGVPAMIYFDTRYFLLIPFFTLGLWITSIVCTRIWLSYRSYKFISQEWDSDNTLNSYDEVFYTQNSYSPIKQFLFRVFKLISRN